MILGADRTRLSKRHGATAVEAYRDLGYLPEALVNYLVRLGWSHGDQEIFTREEMVRHFSLEKVGATAAGFDQQKLDWLNGHYLRQADPAALAARMVPFWRAAGVPEADIARRDPAWLAMVAGLFRERAQTLAELAQGSLPLLRAEVTLDPKAAKGRLGAVLLSRGRRTLALAATAWRADKKEALAAQADAALAEWGEVPDLPIALRLGTPRAQIARLLRSAGEGRAVPVPNVARAFDLLELPFPDEGAEVVVAFFDDSGRLGDILTTYRTGFAEYFPEPVQLAFLLEERALPSEDGATATGLRSLTYRLGELNCAVSVVVHGAGAGAFVRLGGTKETRYTASLPRDFSGANLDRTFEQNRFRLVPEQRGETTLKVAGKALALLRNPLPALKLARAELQREAGQNLTASLLLRYDSDGDAQPALHKMALPLWVALGPGQFQGVSDKNGGHLALVWEDARTRYTLRLPYDSVQPVELEASDRQGLAHVAERQTTTLAQDRRERKQRIDAGKPFVRLERALELIELGWKRSQVRQILPEGQAVLKRDLPGGGLVVTFRGDPAQRDPYVMRQMFVRFDRADHVAEVRVRYVDGPSAGAEGRWMPDLLTRIKKRAGAPTQEPSPWAKLWTDLPPQKPAPVLYRWQDDITVLVYQRDAAGVELALRDWSTDPDGESAPPLWEYLPRGLANLQLGINREELLHKWRISKPVITDDGALTAARLVLVDAVRRVLRNTLDLMGVAAVDRM